MGAAQVDEVLARHVAEHTVEGAVGLVCTGDQVAVSAHGEVTAGRPAARDSLFRISSMTKPVTAYATLLLVQDGRLDLDEPVDRLLPELASPTVFVGPGLADTEPARGPVRVRHLLSGLMGTGIRPAPPADHPVTAEAERLALGQGAPHPQAYPDPDTWLARLGSLPLLHHPGEVWMYNTGLDVAGVLVARACGTTFDAALQDLVLGPLGMTDTGFVARDLGRLGDCWENGATLWDAVDGEWAHAPAFAAGSMGLVSTVDDYLAFARALRDGGPLGPGLRAAMTTDQLGPGPRAAADWLPGSFAEVTWGFGLGVVLGEQFGWPAGSYGWDGGMGGAWRTDPSAGLVTVLLTTRAWSSPVPPPVVQDFWAAARA